MKRSMTWMAILAIVVASSFFWACDNSSSLAPSPVMTPDPYSSAPSMDTPPPPVVPPVQPVEPPTLQELFPGSIRPIADGQKNVRAEITNMSDEPEWVALWCYEDPDGKLETQKLYDGGYSVYIQPEEEARFNIPLPQCRYQCDLVAGREHARIPPYYGRSKELVMSKEGGEGICEPVTVCGDQTLDLDVTVKLEQRPSIIVNKAYIMTVVTDSSQIGNLIIKNKGGKDIKKFGTGKETRTFQYECGDGQVDIKAKTECDEEVETVQIPDCCDACVDTHLKHSATLSPDGESVTIEVSSSNPGVITLNGENKDFPAGSSQIVFDGLECGTDYTYSIITRDDSCGEPVVCNEGGDKFSTPDCPCESCVDSSQSLKCVFNTQTNKVGCKAQVSHQGYLVMKQSGQVIATKEFTGATAAFSDVLECGGPSVSVMLINGDDSCGELDRCGTKSARVQIPDCPTCVDVTLNASLNIDGNNVAHASATGSGATEYKFRRTEPGSGVGPQVISMPWSEDLQLQCGETYSAEFRAYDGDERCETKTISKKAGDCGECEMEITKEVNKKSVKPGNKLTYTLTIENVGNAKCTGGGVLIKDDIPSNVTFTGWHDESGNGSFKGKSGNTLKWNFGVMTPGETGWAKWRGKVSNPQGNCDDFEIPNKARVWSKEKGNVGSNTVYTDVKVECDPCANINTADHSTGVKLCHGLISGGGQAECSHFAPGSVFLGKFNGPESTASMDAKYAIVKGGACANKQGKKYWIFEDVQVGDPIKNGQSHTTYCGCPE